MTVTIVLGKATDGYVWSFDSNYTNSRNGPGDGLSGGSVGFIGQNHNSGYQSFQTFIGFDYTAVPADQKIVGAQIHLSVASVLTPSAPRALEAHLYAWSPGGLTVNDWHNITKINQIPLSGRVWNLNQAGAGEHLIASQDDLAPAVAAATSVEFLVCTDRQRLGLTPSVDEGVSLYLADTDGTASDPALVFTTRARSTLAPALGAAVELSDGTWASLKTVTTDSATAVIEHTTKTGTVTTVGTVPIADSGTAFERQDGAQGLALVVDSSDNLYVLGRLAGTQNTLAAQVWTKNSGTYTWAAKTLRSANMPTYDGAINNVAGAWHPTAGGRIFALVSHSAGTGANSPSAYYANDHLWVLLDTTYLRTGSGSFLRGSGTTFGVLVESSIKSNYHGVPTNETGTLMDVAAAGGANPSWGFTLTARKVSALGDNSRLAQGRYVINAAGTGLDHTSANTADWGVKDANAKARAVRISDSVWATLTTDSDAGYGLSVQVSQYSGLTSAPNYLGSLRLGGEAILNFPAESTIARAPWWDAVFNETENTLWVYYVDSTAPNALRRTAIDMSSMQPLRNSVLVSVLAVGTVINAIRVPRNSAVTERGLVQISSTLSGTISTTTVIDTFNLPPTAPVLIPPVNYDATVAKAFTWTFTDPNPGDTQSAYQLQILDADLGTTALDTGKIVSTVSSHNVAGGTLTNTKSYQWRVKTWDSQDAEGEWSGYGSFQTSAGGAVTITDPATDNPAGLDTDDTYISWVVSGATVQASYRIILRKVAGLVVVSDTGWVTSTATTALVSGMASDVQYRVDVQVRNAALVLSGIGQRLLLPSYATPEPPVVTLTDVSDQGYLLVSVSNPLPGQPEVPGSPEYDFEAGAGDWVATGASVAASTEQAHSGTQSLKMTAVAAPVQMYARNYVQRVPVTTGVRYVARAWVYRPVAGPVTISIEWVNGSNVTQSTTELTIGAVPANTWTLMQVTGPAPAGATFAVFGPTVKSNPPTGTVLYVDDAALIGASDRPDVTKNQLLRRPAGSDDPWDLVATIGVDESVRDYSLSSGKLYEYKARGITA